LSPFSDFSTGPQLSSPRLSIIPAGAVTDRSLEPRDLQALCLLGRHTDKAGWCVRSQVRMSVELGCGRASLQRSLERLVEAGWVEKKRRDAQVAAEGGHVSSSYAYRVVLDRDDYAFENATRDTDSDGDESYAENASEAGGCPPVGTPVNGSDGAQPDGHPGAHPTTGTGAHTYVGTKNDPLERPLLERERDARARDRKVKFLNSFEARWPTAAADDRQRTAYAAEALTEPEEAEALAGIAPFLENLKRLKRTNVPAGWNYLEQKRWTLLEAQKAAGAAPAVFAGDSAEAKAIKGLHDIVGRSEAFWKIWRRADGSVTFSKPMTPQLVALAQVPQSADWVKLTRQQAGAWEHMLRQFFDDALSRTRMREGSSAPWPWPPSGEGKLYTSATGPPETLMGEGEAEDFK
jgi:hypothetical protein